MNLKRAENLINNTKALREQTISLDSYIEAIEEVKGLRDTVHGLIDANIKQFKKIEQLRDLVVEERAWRLCDGGCSKVMGTLHEEEARKQLRDEGLL